MPEGEKYTKCFFPFRCDGVVTSPLRKQATRCIQQRIKDEYFNKDEIQEELRSRLPAPQVEGHFEWVRLEVSLFNKVSCADIYVFIYTFFIMIFICYFTSRVFIKMYSCLILC